MLLSVYTFSISKGHKSTYTDRTHLYNPYSQKTDCRENTESKRNMDEKMDI